VIPADHILLLAVLQFTLGLFGLLLRRAGMIVVVSGLVMWNGVLLAFCAMTERTGSTSQAEGVVVLVLALTVALCGTAVLYAFHRFRRTVGVDEHDRMKH
jgi:NADH:ubiquinone oxidoreductase subunit K